MAITKAQLKVGDVVESQYYDYLLKITSLTVEEGEPEYDGAFWGQRCGYPFVIFHYEMWVSCVPVDFSTSPNACALAEYAERYTLSDCVVIGWKPRCIPLNFIKRILTEPELMQLMLER